MSTEDIIHSWKNEDKPGKKPANPKKKPGQAPANPAGEQELNDEDLEIIEGGLVAQGSQAAECSCKDNSCN